MAPFVDLRPGQPRVQDGDRQNGPGLPEVRQIPAQGSNKEASGRHVGREGRTKGECFVPILSMLWHSLSPYTLHVVAEHLESMVKRMERWLVVLIHLVGSHYPNFQFSE